MNQSNVSFLKTLAATKTLSLAKVLSVFGVACVVTATSAVASASGASCPRLPQVMDCNGYDQNLKVEQSGGGFKFELNEKVRTVGTGLVLDGRTQAAIENWNDSDQSFDLLLATGQCQGNQIEVVMTGKDSQQVWTFEKRDSKNVLLTVSYRNLNSNQQRVVSRLSCEKSAN